MKPGPSTRIRRVLLLAGLTATAAIGAFLTVSNGEPAEPEEAKKTEEGKVGKADRNTRVGRVSDAPGIGARGDGIGRGRGDGSFSIGTKGRGSGSGAYSPGAARAADRSLFARASTEQYTDPGTNAPVLTEDDSLSTFAVDVDTASYAIARRKLRDGTLPPAAAVRVEEFVNYLPYDYVAPTGGAPFAVHMEAAPSPWDATHCVLRVGVQGREAKTHRPAHLVFLVDVSGSMDSDDKIGLVKRSLAWLVRNLEDEDTVAIATYAGRSERVLPPTPVTEATRILAAIDGLSTGGGTNMGSGMELAYAMAREGLAPGAESRVVVLSDGDANLGATTHEQMLAFIQARAKEGVTLSTVGFGMGNYKDTMMEQLADKGDGNYAYVDLLAEAKRVFGTGVAGTIETIARDVKIQVEFDPEAVLAWRLLGYENRDVADGDFRDDAVDGGEVGSGHQVTALYDVVLRDGYRERARVARVRIRAKPPGPDRPAEEWFTEFPPRLVHDELADAAPDFRIAVGTAAFAEKLRGSRFVAEVTWEQVAAIVQHARRPGRAEDEELLGLVGQAAELDGVRVARR